MTTGVISEHPPRDGKSYAPHCARCGNETEFVDCSECGGEGCFDEYETDAINYAPGEEFSPCHLCEGEGGWRVCFNSADWCDANPMPGREDVKRGAIEWKEYEP